MQKLRLLACQINIPLTRDAAARDAHLDDLSNRIANHAGRRSHDLIVLPELSSIEYSNAAFDHLDVLAEPRDGASTQCFSKLARELGATVVFGFPRSGTDGRYVSQAVVDPDGSLIGCYDKLHIAQFGASCEAPHFLPGNGLLIFEVAGFRVAVMICYDIRFPGLAQRLAREGVDLILQPGAYYRDLSFHSWRPFVVTRAMEHGFAWLGLNRAGVDWGGSIWCPGYADTEVPEQVLGTGETFWSLELPGSFRQRAAERLPFLRDRRGDYGTLPLNRD